MTNSSWLKKKRKLKKNKRKLRNAPRLKDSNKLHMSNSSGRITVGMDSAPVMIDQLGAPEGSLIPTPREATTTTMRITTERQMSTLTIEESDRGLRSPRAHRSTLVEMGSAIETIRIAEVKDEKIIDQAECF